MTDPRPPLTPFWHTVLCLLRAARQRTRGRSARQRELMQRRTGASGNQLGQLGTLLAVCFAVLVHGLFVINLIAGLRAVARSEIETRGKLVVSDAFLAGAFAEGRPVERPAADVREAIRAEAKKQTRSDPEAGDQRVEQLRDQLVARGRDGFVAESSLADIPHVVAAGGRLAQAVGTLVLLWWFAMLALQGEGMELDSQRRRHPMWEWLLSHPVHPGAAFFAEMLSPMAANVTLATAPAFWMMALYQVHGTGASLVAGLLIGLVMSLAASFVSKAVEVWAMLLLPPRSRGATLGILSWLGYVLLIAQLFALGQRMPAGVITSLWRVSAWLPIPALSWAVGLRGDGTASLLLGSFSALVLAGTVAAACVGLVTWATSRGLQGSFGDTPSSPHKVTASGASRFARDPLHRKELLWLWRDRGAIVQVFLFPLSMAALQAFNFRGLVAEGSYPWNGVCGLGIICGTYFLLMLGPRSLVSEGPALWIALTWPLGLEALLRAKARLWSWIATGVVGAILVLAAIRYPSEGFKIGLVLVGWTVFARSLAEKSVTLVTAPSSSGEPERAPKSRQFAATLGSFSFASGVITKNWHVATLGVVFSTLSAAAMWQNFRSRLPFLLDPWSETKPRPPTLMHAMIAITGMLEGMAVLLMLLLFVFGEERVVPAVSLAYGIAGVVAWIATSSFLEGEGVDTGEVWRWRRPAADDAADAVDASPWREGMSSMATGLVGGAVLGLGAHGYIWLLRRIPLVAEQLAEQGRRLAEHPDDRIWMAFAAVAMAPLAEEFLFRGLLYRALDREWGGWQAILGSAAFFGVYHPPLSWIPVTGLGILCAWLFKRTGRLGACVLAHVAYNSVVALLWFR